MSSTGGGHRAGLRHCEHPNQCDAESDTIRDAQGFRVRLIDGLERAKIPPPRRRLRVFTSPETSTQVRLPRVGSPGAWLIAYHSEMDRGHVEG